MPQTDERTYSQALAAAPAVSAPTGPASSLTPQPAGNQAALEAAGLSGASAGSDSVESSLVGDLLAFLPLPVALTVALSCPAAPLCAALLRATGIGEALRAVPDRVLAFLDGCFPSGTSVTLTAQLEVALEVLLGAEWSYTVGRDADRLTLDLSARLAAGAKAGWEDGGPLGEAIRKAKGEAEALAFESLEVGYDLPLDAGLFARIFGPSAADLVSAGPAAVWARMEAVAAERLALCTPERLRLGVGAELTAEGELDREQANGGAGEGARSGEVEGEASASAEAAVGYDEGGWYAEGVLGGEVEASARVGFLGEIEAKLGMDADALTARLGGELRVRVRGTEEAVTGSVTGASQGLTYEVSVTTTSGARGLLDPGAAILTETDAYTFGSIDGVVAWVRGRLSDSQESALVGADWSRPGGIPGAELPDVDYQRSFVLEPGDLEGLANVYPDEVQGLGHTLAVGGLSVKGVSTLRLAGTIRVDADAARMLVGPGASLPVVNDDPEATMVGLERRLADAAMSAATHGSAGLVIDGRDVSMAASSIALRDLDLEAEYAVSASADVEVYGQGAEGSVEGLVSRHAAVPELDAASLLARMAG